MRCSRYVGRTEAQVLSGFHQTIAEGVQGCRGMCHQRRLGEGPGAREWMDWQSEQELQIEGERQSCKEMGTFLCHIGEGDDLIYVWKSLLWFPLFWFWWNTHSIDSTLLPFPVHSGIRTFAWLGSHHIVHLEVSLHSQAQTLFLWPWCYFLLSMDHFRCLTEVDSCTICPVWLAYFTGHNVFKVLVCCSLWPNAPISRDGEYWINRSFTHSCVCGWQSAYYPWPVTSVSTVSFGVPSFFFETSRSGRGQIPSTSYSRKCSAVTLYKDGVKVRLCVLLLNTGDQRRRDKESKVSMRAAGWKVFPLWKWVWELLVGTES